MDLHGLQPQIEVISPEESAKRGMRAMGELVREQGTVMSAALQNNESLYYTNKRLRSEREQLLEEIKQLRFANTGLAREVDRLKSMQNPNAEEFAAMKTRCEQLEAGNQLLQEELERQLTPETTQEERKAAIDMLRRQQQELAESGLVPSEEWINARPEDRAKMI